MEISLYQGETPAISRAPQAQTATTHPMQQLWDQNAARATQNAYALEDTIVDYIEDTRTQQLKAEQNQIEQDLKDDLTQALSLANGAPGSPFKKDGLPNEAAIRSLINKHQSRIRNWESGYLSLQGAQTAALAQQQFRTSIGNTVKSTITGALKPRALSAFKNNYNYAIAQGRTQDAIASVDDLYNKGYIDEAEAALYKLDAQEKGVDYQIAHLQNFEEADSLYNDPDFTRDCTTAQLRALENTLDHFAAQSIPPGTILKSGRKAGSTNPQDYEKTAPLPPAGLPYFMQDIYTNHNGDFSTKNPAGRIEATRQLYNWALTIINPDDPYNLEDENIFRAQTDIFGIEAEAVNRTLKEVRAAIADTSAPSLKDALKNIPGHVLYQRMPADQYERYANKETSEQDKEIILQNYFLRYHGTEDLEAFKQSGLSLAQWYKAQEKASKAAITSDYSSWIGNGKNSSNSPEIKIAQIDTTLRKHLTKRDYKKSLAYLEPFINQVRQTELDRIARKEKHAKTRDEINAQTSISNYAREIEESKAADLFHPLTYTGSNLTALPYSTTAPVIYVPPGFTELGEIGQDVPVVDPSSGKPIAARIMEVDGIKSPTISSVLSRLFRLYKRKGAPLTITRSQGRIFITPAPIEADSYQQAEQGTTPTYGEVSQNNQLLP